MGRRRKTDMLDAIERANVKLYRNLDVAEKEFADLRARDERDKRERLRRAF